jgi:hypothetical protein
MIKHKKTEHIAKLSRKISTTHHPTLPPPPVLILLLLYKIYKESKERGQVSGSERLMWRLELENNIRNIGTRDFWRTQLISACLVPILLIFGFACLIQKSANTEGLRAKLGTSKC